MFKKSVSYWSFAGGLENTAPYEEVFAEAKRRGYDAVEPCVGAAGVLTPKTSEKKIAAIRQMARDAGVEISSVATGMFWDRSMSDDRKSVRDRMIDDAKRCLEIAAALGTNTLLVIPGAVDVFFNPKVKVVDYDVVDKRARQAVRRLLPTAERVKVAIAIAVMTAR